MTIFVVNDVVFDLLAKREPFYKYAAQLFTNADKQEVTICVSSLCFGNLKDFKHARIPVFTAEEFIKQNE